MQVSPIADRFRRPKGLVTLVLRDLAGNVVDVRRANIVTDVARQQVADWAAQDFTEKINEISVGDGGHDPGDPNIPIPPSEGDTALDNETARKTIATITNPTVTDTQFVLTFATTEANGSITEAGLHTVPGDRLFARVTFPEIVKTASFTLTVTWKILF